MNAPLIQNERDSLLAFLEQQREAVRDEACGRGTERSRRGIAQFLVRALAHLGSFEQVARMHVLKARYQRRFLAAVRSLVEHAALARCAVDAPTATPRWATIQ